MENCKFKKDSYKGHWLIYLFLLMIYANQYCILNKLENIDKTINDTESLVKKIIESDTCKIK